MLNFSTCVSLCAKNFSPFRVHILGPVYKYFPFYTFQMLYNQYSFHDSQTAAHKIIPSSHAQNIVSGSTALLLIFLLTEAYHGDATTST
jgi:hypothetical protein